MSSRDQCTQEEFVVMLCRAGLDPGQHDVVELHAAWLLLESQLQRLLKPHRQPATQPLGVFNPHDFIRAADRDQS